MPTLPSAEDVGKAREQATGALNRVFERARTPLLAMLGASDLAAKVMADALHKTRERVTQRTETAKSTVNDIPAKLEPAELRKAVETYGDAVLKQYKSWAKHGEETLEKLRTRPEVKKAIHQVEGARDKALHQVETTRDIAASAVEDARGLADDMLGKVARRTRSVGEKAATRTEKAADKVAEEVSATGAEVASTTRSASRKAASSVSQPKTGSATTTRRTTTTRK